MGGGEKEIAVEEQKDKSTEERVRKLERKIKIKE